MSTIRVMTENDLPQVLRLSEQLGYPGKLPEFKSRFLELQTSPLHTLIVLVIDKKIVGWMHLEIVLDLIEHTMTEIKAIIVDETVRGMGLGHQLIEYAKKWSKDQGLSTIYLSCNIIRSKTHEFYKREGFSLNRTSHFFILDY